MIEVPTDEYTHPVSTKELADKILAIGEYRFTLIANERMSIPEFAGSLLRGSFGWALRGLTCMTKAESCNGCTLYSDCSFPALFSPKPNERLAKRFPSIPAPYLFLPPHNIQGELNEGDTFTFHLTLFGEYAISQLGLIIVAWERASYVGLGKGKAQAELLKVEHLTNQGAEIIYQPNERIKTHQPQVRLQSLNTPLTSITLKIITPTRIQHENKLLNGEQLNARIFLNGLQRKVLLYGICHLELDIEKLPLAENIGFEANLYRRSFYRYSNRQKQKMNLEGLLGTITLSGDLSSWWPLLQLGQYTHIGKNTSFGLGHYQITHLNGKVYDRVLIG